MTRIARPATLIAALLLSTGLAHAEDITFVTFSGYYPPQLFDEFEKATGIHVNLVEVATNEETMGRMVASNGAGFDVMIVSSPFVTALENLGMLAEVDHDKIPNLKNLYDEAFNLPYDPGLKLSVPYAWGTFGLCYRKDLVSPAPTSWADLLQPSDAIKGKYTMVPDERWFMEPAQKLLGKSINDVSEETLAAIRPLLESGKKDVLTFDGFTQGSRLISGESVMASTWEAWCNMAARDGGDVDYVVPKEGGDTWVDTFVIPKATEHKEAAETFIDFVLRPEVHSWLITELLYKVPNKAAMESVDPEFYKKYPAYRYTAADLGKNEILMDLGADAPRVSKFVTEVMAAQ
ncbi:spermidine/putrescine ABC transporter substrate-binding protein [Albidovulum sp.]|uniref:polyamine ABC transporter substrate-binding protein n=1 Tax=Albidovulum sp. TaxID=1872424 RepID=UPI0039B87070